MDDLDTDPASQGLPAPPTAHPPAPPTTTRSPGRPARDPAARQAADERYAQLKEIERGMPARAREFRFAIFSVRPGTEHKATHRPLKTILWSVWQEEGLEDDGALASYLERVLGPGRYLIEPRDAHNKRVDRLASFCIATDEEEEDSMYDYDENTDLDMIPARSGRRRRRRRGHTEDLPYLIEDEDDDPIEARTNIADMLTEQARLQAKEREATTRSSGDMVQTMLLLSQQREADQERRREDERRREEAREQARREEYRREEDRRAEDRRREEERRAEERRREDDRRAEERRAADEKSAQRIQLILGAFTAVVPVISKMLEGKPNTLLETVIAKTMEPKEDTTQALLLKHILDKSQGEQSINQVIQGMANVSKASVDMMQQQFSSMQGVTAEMYQTAMKRALDVAMKNPNTTEEDKGVLGQIMEIMSGAGELIGNLRGGQPQPGMMMMPGQPVIQQGQPMPGQPMPGQPMPGQPVPGQPVPGQPMPQPAPGQPVVPPEDIPTGIRAVGACLMAIQQQAYQDQTQYQNLLAMMISEMPDDVRQAVASNDEATVLAQCGAVFAADPELKAWITAPGSAQWLREFLAQLAPQIEEMHQQIVQVQTAAQQETPPAEGERPQVEEGGPHFIDQDATEAPPVSMDDIVGGDHPGSEEGAEGQDDGEDGDPNDPV